MQAEPGSRQRTIGRTPDKPSTLGIKVYKIAHRNGIINQEAQCADEKRRFDALMRDNSSVTSRYYHYLRSADKKFTKTAISVAELSTPL
jgi:hypothetical protein